MPLLCVSGLACLDDKTHVTKRRGCISCRPSAGHTPPLPAFPSFILYPLPHLSPTCPPTPTLACPPSLEALPSVVYEVLHDGGKPKDVAARGDLGAQGGRIQGDGALHRGPRQHLHLRARCGVPGRCQGTQCGAGLRGGLRWERLRRVCSWWGWVEASEGFCFMRANAQLWAAGARTGAQVQRKTHFQPWCDFKLRPQAKSRPGMQPRALPHASLCSPMLCAPCCPRLSCKSIPSALVLPG